MPNMQIRPMRPEDDTIISAAFQAQGEQTHLAIPQILRSTTKNERVVLLATQDSTFTVYVTLLWKSSDPYFSQPNIPEIKDFNVLIAYRN